MYKLVTPITLFVVLCSNFSLPNAAEAQIKESTNVKIADGLTTSELSLLNSAATSFKRVKSRACTPPTIASGSGLVAKIIGIDPCNNVTPSSDEVTVSMASELGLGAQAPDGCLIIHYLFCINTKTGQLVQKSATSVWLHPGTGFCMMPEDQVEVEMGTAYKLVAWLTKYNDSDDSETILATKSCKFTVN